MDFSIDATNVDCGGSIPSWGTHTQRSGGASTTAARAGVGPNELGRGRESKFMEGSLPRREGGLLSRTDYGQGIVPSTFRLEIAGNFVLTGVGRWSQAALYRH